MRITSLILVRSTRHGSDRMPLYTLKPLFLDGPVVQDQRLNRGTGRLVKDLRRRIVDDSRSGDHGLATRAAYAPQVELSQQKVLLEAEQTARVRVAVASMRALGRRIAFLPELPAVWFEVPRGQSVSVRVEEVLTRELRAHIKAGGTLGQFQHQVDFDGKQWLTRIDYDADTEVAPQKQTLNFFSALFNPEVGDGAFELQQTGRCLDTMYPDELDRAIEREQDVDTLGRMLASGDRRPVLVVGPRGVGKTALIHETVYRRVDAKQQQYLNKNNVWLLSPQRLISGMSYVGQWENRLLAILKEAAKKDHVLYFDDLIGLFHAGVSRDSNLCVADVLKPWLDSRRIRVVGEITPRALRVLKETDRGFADLFHSLVLTEPDPETNLRIQIQTVRQIEHQSGHAVNVDVLPLILDLARRYSGGVVSPGAASRMLKRLAARFQGQAIHRYNVIADFRERTGLHYSFVETSDRLPRHFIESGIRSNLVGQDAAVEAATDVIGVARARLNDPTRPLGCFLFLGPTGVGKTQCAKAICQFLFGSADKIVRFDMNEFVHPAAVARLVGTRGNPEGLLTTAVRRQPFCVLLFDEIEKADPDMFDLLLQVLGEGRLTDALGRTTDFTNTIVIMTSNLGAREASTDFGFGDRASEKDGVYVAAAERFFRPEFLNRIDRVIPFDPLSEEQVRKIAAQSISDLSKREGFQRRQCTLLPDESVIERTLRIGFDPKWGARGVRRAIENDLLRPIAEELAKRPAAGATIIEIYETDGTPSLDVIPIAEADRVAGCSAVMELGDPLAVSEAVANTAQRMKDELSRWRSDEPLVSGAITPEQYLYLAMRERLDHLLARATAFGEALSTEDLHGRLGRSNASLASVTLSGGRPGRLRIQRGDGDYNRALASEVAALDDVYSYFDDLLQRGPTSESDEQLRKLVQEATLLDAVLPGDDGWQHQRAVVFHTTFGRGTVYGEDDTITEWFQNASTLPGVDSDERETIYEIISAERALGGDPPKHSWPRELRQMISDADLWPLCIEGPRLDRLLSPDEGLHLFAYTNTPRTLLHVTVRIVPEGEGYLDFLTREIGAFLDWRTKRRCGAATSADNPFPIGPLVRVYGDESAVDLLTGLAVPDDDDDEIDSFEAFVGRLPLPAELQAVAEPARVPDAPSDSDAVDRE